MKVKIKHVIALEPDAIDKLVMAILAATKVVYASEVEEMTTIKSMLEPEIHEAIWKSFKAGKNIGKMGADAEDTTMYTEDTPAAMPVTV